MEHNTLCVEGIEGKEIIDKHFTSEEIKLVRRLPKTLQERALKCLKEQKLIGDSSKKPEPSKVPISTRHNEKLINGFFMSGANKKTSKKANLKRSESTSIARVQPISTNLLKSTKTVSPKRTFKIPTN